LCDYDWCVIDCDCDCDITLTLTLGPKIENKIKIRKIKSIIYNFNIDLIIWHLSSKVRIKEKPYIRVNLL